MYIHWHTGVDICDKTCIMVISLSLPINYIHLLVCVFVHSAQVKVPANSNGNSLLWNREVYYRGWQIMLLCYRGGRIQGHLANIAVWIVDTEIDSFGQNHSKCRYTCTCRGISSQTVHVVSTFYRSKWVDCFWLVKALSCLVEGRQNDSKNQSKMPLCAHLGQQSKQAVDWFWPL